MTCLSGDIAGSTKSVTSHQGSTLLGDGVVKAQLSLVNGASVLGSQNSSLAEDILLERADNALAHLPLNTVVDSVEDIVDSDTRLVGRLSTLLVDTSLDQDAVPVVGSLLVNSVGTTDVTLGSVADKVDGLRRSNKAMLSVAPLAHETGSKLKGGDLGLAKGVGVKLALAVSQITESDLEHAAESTHAKSDVLVSGRPDDIVVREVEWGTLVKGSAAGADTAALGHGEVEHDLDVAGPVTGVGKDEDGINDNVGEVAVTRSSVLLRSELAEGGGGRVVLDDVARGNDISEAVALSDLTALLTLTADNKDSLVLLGHLPHGGVAADELARLDVALELAGEITAALLLSLAATVGEEDVRYFNAVLVLTVENLHGLDGLRDGLSTADQDTIDIKGVDERVGHKGVLTIAGG